MDNNLFLLLFMTGLVPLGVSVTRKYYLFQPGETWSNAQALCRAHYTDMLTIRSNTEMSLFKTTLQNLYTGAWIGLWNDINSWRWSNGNEALGKKTGTDQYIVYTDLKTWTDAQAFCRQHHTDLASARNATEHSIIRVKISGYTIFGLFRDSWKWSDQSSVSNISWAPGEPNNAGGSDNCAYLNNSHVHDASCSDIKPFICYQVAVQRKIIRFNVLSDQDVSNPTVMAAIMEKIQQKLKEHKIVNVTVKWREQADGTVFKKPKKLNDL